MRLADRPEYVCKGKVKNKGKNKWLIKKGATVESCQLACLKDKKCKFASLQEKVFSGYISVSKFFRLITGKAKCASYKKCKHTKEDLNQRLFVKEKVAKEKVALRRRMNKNE